MCSALDDSLRIEVYDCLDSTNTLLQKRAAEGEPEGLVAVADTQTSGRGRKQRAYFCPPGTGLYCSILLRPTFPPSEAASLTVAAAAAAAQAIETLSGQPTGIKWVNDIWISERKVCGILTEASVSPDASGLDYAIVGIGINVYEPPEGFPEALSDIAAAIFPQNQIRRNFRAELLIEILRNFLPYYHKLTEKPYFEEYKRRSFTIGRRVTVIGTEVNRMAEVLDIDRDCHLIVRYDDGSIRALNSGEISVKLSGKG